MKNRNALGMMLFLVLLFGFGTSVLAYQEADLSDVIIVHDFNETLAFALDNNNNLIELPVPATPRSWVQPSHVQYVEVSAFVDSLSPFNAIMPRSGFTQVTNTMQTPYNNVVRIVTTWPHGDPTVASGIMVSTNGLFTAAHAIYNPYRGGWARRITVSVAQNGSFLPFGTANATQVAVPAEWRSGAAGRVSSNDFGAISLDRNIGGINTIMRFNNTDNELRGIHVTAVGYPSGGTNMFRTSGTVESFVWPGAMITSHTPSEGLSGGPVFNAHNHVIGLHAGSPDGRRSLVPRFNQRFLDTWSAFSWLWILW